VFVDDSVAQFQAVKSTVNSGTALQIVGQLVASPGKEQKVELKAKEIVVLGACDAETYPIAKKEHTLEFLRTVGHFRPRTVTLSAVARVRNVLAMAVHEFFQKRGFIYCHTPLITCSDCEGAGEMFCVTTLLADKGKPKNPPMTKDDKVDYSQDFFKRPAFLTVSGQLNAEIYATAMSKVYTFGPTFRAEESRTPRHLAEFWMIEPEIAFADLKENMEIAEAFVKFVVKQALDKCPKELEFFEKNEKTFLEEGLTDEQKKELEKKKSPSKEWRKVPLRERLRTVISQPFARITYTEAIELLEKSGVKFEIPCPKWGDDLNSEHERYIAEVVHKKPVIVTDYPKKLKAFYMRANEDGKTVAAMDVLVPGMGEIIGGSQREERYEFLLQRMQELGMAIQPLQWYLDLRKYGSVPHSGFGLGFERLICYVTGLENIRDAIPFPRYPGHADY
jgi:asparaginyl-tRNA synthetase